MNHASTSNSSVDRRARRRLASFRRMAQDYEREPIEYAKRTPANRVSRLVDDLASGETTLRREPRLGYLRSLLKQLDVSPSSQTLVFSKTSLQRQSHRAAHAAGRLLQRRHLRRLLPRRRRAGNLDGRRRAGRRLLHARSNGRRRAVDPSPDRQLPALPRLVVDQGRAGPHDPLRVQRSGGLADSVVGRLPHEPHQPLRTSLGRLVRHRHARFAEAHGQPRLPRPRAGAGRSTRRDRTSPISPIAST